ncbi:MAG TPA: beta-galactosidase [Armatimonadota bacterium]|nr:beta-galactosidase [Armatimonadota bacterium]
MPKMICFPACTIAAALAGAAVAEPPRPVEFVWFAEGESCANHDWSDPVVGNADYAECYSGGHLVCAMDGDPEGDAYVAKFAADVPEDGTYVLWLAATRPETASPLAVTVDGSGPAVVQGGARVGMWGPSKVFSWMPCARVGLTAGEHEIAVGVFGRRPHDNKYYAYLDAVALERVGDDADAAFEPHPIMPEIDETLIRFYSGNASVGHFMQYWGTGNEGDTGAINDATIATLKRVGCTAMCDYLAWCRIEEEPGNWDFSFYEENARKVLEAGIDYNIFAWVHFPPKWFMDTDDWVPYRCLEHDEELQQMSLWSPFALRIFDEFYGRLARDFGERIAFIRVAMPSEYGEIGYAATMTHWLVPQEHVHTGYWCGDEHARADFRDKMKARFRTTDRLNSAWGTGVDGWDDVAPPEDPSALAAEAIESGSPELRRRWLDFVDWYQDSWGDFAVESTEIVRRHFPGKEMILSLGYGVEPVPWGNDQGRHIKRMAEAEAAAQTPGDIGYFATRRVSTACRVYDVPYFTEPPGNVDRHSEMRRIFYDISNGTQTWFDYLQNMDGARDLLAENIQHLTGSPAKCDVAYLMPSSWWWCRPEMHWPERTIRFAEGLRDQMDYEVVDELLVRDGALEKLGIRVLAVCEGDFMRRDTLVALRKWVRGGGVLGLMGTERIEDIDGDTEVFDSMAPAGGADTASDAWQLGRKVGKGRVVLLLGADDAAMPAQQQAMLDLTYRLSELDPMRANAILVDEEKDDVVATVFADRALLYNGTGRMARKTIRFRESDFPVGQPRPAAMQTEVVVPAHRVRAVRFE